MGQRNGCGILQLVSCRPVGGLHLTDYGRCQRGTLFQVALNVLSSCCHIRACGADSAANWCIYPLPPLNDPLRTVKELRILSIVPLLPLSFPTAGSEVSLCLRTEEERKRRCVIWMHRGVEWLSGHPSTKQSRQGFKPWTLPPPIVTSYEYSN